LPEKTETSGQYKNSNNRSNRGPQSNFSTTQNTAGIHHIPTTIDNASNHRTGRPTSQNTKTQPKSFSFFSPEECSGHQETRKRNCSRELFEGTALVGIMPTWAVLPPEKPSTK
jgi:hypothetical protein